MDGVIARIRGAIAGKELVSGKNGTSGPETKRGEARVLGVDIDERRRRRLVEEKGRGERGREERKARRRKERRTEERERRRRRE